MYNISRRRSKQKEANEKKNGKHTSKPYNSNDYIFKLGVYFLLFVAGYDFLSIWEIRVRNMHVIAVCVIFVRFCFV